MKKRIAVILLAFVMVLSLAACGGNKPKTDTDMAKAAIEGFYGAIKDFKISDLKEYVSKDLAGEMTEEALGSGDEVEIMKVIFSKVTAVYKSGEIEKDATSGKLTYTLGVLDMKSLMGQLMELALSGSAEPDMTKINWDKVDVVEKDVEIEVKKEDDKWIIANPETAIINIMGGEGFGE